MLLWTWVGNAEALFSAIPGIYREAELQGTRSFVFVFGNHLQQLHIYLSVRNEFSNFFTYLTMPVIFYLLDNSNATSIRQHLIVLFHFPTVVVWRKMAPEDPSGLVLLGGVVLLK